MTTIWDSACLIRATFSLIWSIFLLGDEFFLFGNILGDEYYSMDFVGLNFVLDTYYLQCSELRNLILYSF